MTLVLFQEREIAQIHVLKHSDEERQFDSLYVFKDPEKEKSIIVILHYSEGVQIRLFLHEQG